MPEADLPEAISEERENGEKAENCSLGLSFSMIAGDGCELKSGETCDPNNEGCDDLVSSPFASDSFTAPGDAADPKEEKDMAPEENLPNGESFISIGFSSIRKEWGVSTAESHVPQDMA